MSFSVVIPAHNEELLLARGLAAIAEAAEEVDEPVEVIVVANRCTDATEEIAHRAGATVVLDESRNIAAVRNAGVTASSGDVIVTIDADSTMSPRAFVEIERLLATGGCVGGGTKVIPERRSPGIRATIGLVDAITFVTGLSGGMFWCRREDFDAVGGFDEGLLVGEDLDFARRLGAHGKRTGRKLTMLRDAPMIASCRKFDRFGDWHMFAMAGQLREIRAVVKGTSTAWVDHYFFDFNDAPADSSNRPAGR